MDAEPRAPSSLEHLRAVTRDVQLRLGETLASAGDHGLRPGFAPFLERVHDGALPIGELAAVLGVSPQAASRTARTLEELGYVSRRASVTDGRSRLVTLTPRGRALLERAHATFAACEQAYARLIGRPVVERILRDLEVLHFGLGLTPEPGPVVQAPDSRSIGTSVLVTLYASRCVRRALAARGHGGLRPSHQELLVVMGPRRRTGDATPPGHMRISRQAVSAMVQDLEHLGYLRRGPDTRDGRAVVLTPTALGEVGPRGHGCGHVGRRRGIPRCPGPARWARLERDLAVLDEGDDGDGGSGPVPGPTPRPGPPATDRPWTCPVWRTGCGQRLGPADAARLGAMLVLSPGRTRVQAQTLSARDDPQEPRRPGHRGLGTTPRTEIARTLHGPHRPSWPGAASIRGLWTVPKITCDDRDERRAGRPIALSYRDPASDQCGSARE